MNIARLLDRVADYRRDAIAISQDGIDLSYGEFRERAASLGSSLLRLGLAPGDRVAFIQRNSPAMLISLLAAFRAGFCAVPLNARSTPYEAAQVFDDAGVRAVIYDGEFAAHAAEAGDALRICTDQGGSSALTFADACRNGNGNRGLYDATPDTVAWLFYTSGTTGRMKGATLTHRNLLSMLTAYLSDVRSLEPTATVLHAAPLSHGSGLYALPAIARGARQILTSSRSFDCGEIFSLVSRERVTDIAFLAPTMVKWLVEARSADDDTSSLVNVVYGGGPMYVDDLKQAHSAFGNVFTQIYGQAEAPVTIARLTRADHAAALVDAPDHLMSAGQPYTCVDVAVVDGDEVHARGSGEIAVRGDVVMRGYWNDDEATARSVRDGWLRTGDVGRIDEEGFVYLLDRSKDVIISGAANIYPREVEEVILESPHVQQVAVVGAPDDQWGERVVAVVAPYDDVDRASLERELDELCKTRLAGYKRPRQYEWANELPTSPYGKILKREIRDRFWQGRGRKI